ncbi:MAG: TRAP transporter substrate-binding protein [Planctomycetota bacterium]|jgi:C4-dicarboxylate-binding protein DctP|nr:TRAP transporter substrate-binding protein [Planctomycetota bacterium]
MKSCFPTLAAVLASALAAGAALAAETVKISHDLSEDTPQHLGCVKWKDLVERRTAGKYKIDIFPSNQLGDDREVAEMLQVGTVQAALIPTAKLSLFAPALQIPDLPFFFPTREICYELLDSEVGAEILDRLSSKGMIGVSFWESGFKQFTANKELRRPEDFKGLKFRTMESKIIIGQFKALGANPVPISFGETYNALQQGTVDGQENPLVSITRMRFYEVQKHMLVSNHAYLAYGFLFSKRWLERQPLDMRKILIDSAREVAAFQREETVRREQGFIDTIAKAGCKVSYLTPEDAKLFAEATRPVHKEFEDSIGKELLTKAYNKIEELQKQRPGAK